MTTLLEQQRQALEDIECYERMVNKSLENKPKSHRERIRQGNRVSLLLNKVKDRSVTANEFAVDSDGSRKEEIQSMKGDAVFSSFYDRLKDLRDYHRRFPDIAVQNQPDTNAEDLQPDTKFSGEEMYGKYLDLHQLYERSSNMPQFDRSDYTQYLGRFSEFEKVEKSKKNKAYFDYVSDMKNYLIGFYTRTQPLVDLEDILKETLEAFSKQWDEDQQSRAQSGSLDLTGFTNAKQLEALGLDRLKSALEAEELKCGGNLEQRAARLFSIKGVPKDKIPKKLRAKGAKPKQAEEGGIASSSQAGSRGLSYQVAEAEIVTQKLCELLAEVIENTQTQVEKKQTRTVQELEAEQEEEEAGVEDVAEEEESDDETPFYNPLNLPLGWDGKPIPYWLYKLHGLGIEFKCEICGNQSYWGRRAFDRHFQEWRHAHGMRCLGIPNTKHFHDITLIEDAINRKCRCFFRLPIPPFPLPPPSFSPPFFPTPPLIFSHRSVREAEDFH
jgi:splicing factor 3A subunit 3